ncbi:MAG: efflux RND transporter periplasmic adaptor subunit [Barnesiella sp.]|nr:efflux RND transporter periplasmic adaptor subunit [Barnesiella sp.]
MKNVLYLIMCAAVIGLFTPSCAHTAEQDGLGHHHHHGHEHHDHDHEGHEHHDHEHEDHDHEGHEHEHEHEGEEHEAGVIHLTPAQIEEFGVKSTVVEPRDFSEVIKVSGQVISAPGDRSVVSAKSSGIITFSRGIAEGVKVNRGQTVATISAKGMAGGDSNEAARVAYEAAKRELDRLTPLHADGIVSTRDYNAALQAFEQARAAYSGNSSGSAASASTAGVITSLLVRQGEFVNAGQPIAEISGNTELTLRADLPEKYFRVLPSITSARFRTAYSDGVIDLANLNGHRVADQAAVGSRAGYLPVYFRFNNNGEVVPGTSAEVYLIGSSRGKVLAVPTSSLSEQQGQLFVFVQLDEDCFRKVAVKTGQSNGQEVEILSGLKEGEQVVTEGTTFVRLAETSGVVPEGHSHTH